MLEDFIYLAYSSKGLVGTFFVVTSYYLLQIFNDCQFVHFSVISLLLSKLAC